MDRLKSPHAPEAETSVLGAILLDPASLDRIRGTIRPGDFFDPRNKLVFEAAQRLADSGSPVDPVSLAEELRSVNKLDRVGGTSYLADLSMAEVSSAHVVHHARMIREKARARKLVELAEQIRVKACEPGAVVAEVLAGAEQQIFKLADIDQGRGIKTLGEVAVEAYRGIEERHQNQGKISGVPTGFYELDALTSGLQASDLIVLAARPGMGKTALALCLAEAAGLRDVPSLLFSLEMSRVQLASRYLSGRARVPSHRLRSGFIHDNQWSGLVEAVGEAKKLPIFLDDKPAQPVLEIRSKARQAKRLHGIGLVIIDYLQLLRSEVRRSETREREIANVSAHLKAMAKELNLPVLALSQLNRQLESRPLKDRRPKLSDLRESGAIEQDADLVMFLHREEVFLVTAENKGIAELNVAKHRNGPLGRVQLLWRPEFTRFENLKEDGNG